MKAIVVKQFGSADHMAFTNIETPAPKQGEVLIKIKYTAVNPFDWKVIAIPGLGEMFGLSSPIIPGSEFSGIVEAVGANTSQFQIGAEVIGHLGNYGGALAEYIAVDENNVVRKPEGVDFKTAAALGVGGRTASLAIFDVAGLKQGQKILIHGASGGVGSMAVQLAKNKGAYVIATASSENIKLVESLGADQVIDYKTQNFYEVISDMDVVLDTIGGENQVNSFKVLKKGGFLVSIVENPSEELKAKYEVQGAIAVVDAKKERLEEIVQLVATGKIRPLVETVISIDNIKEAFELSMAGNRKGKILIAVDK